MYHAPIVSNKKAKRSQSEICNTGTELKRMNKVES